MSPLQDFATRPNPEGRLPMPIHQATLEEIFQEIASRTAGADVSNGPDGAVHGLGGVMERHFVVALPPSIVGHKLAAFPQQWFGQTFRGDDQTFVFRITLPASLWRRLRGKRAGVEVVVRLTNAATAAEPCTQVTAAVKPLPGNEPASRSFIEELGNDILVSLHTLLVDSGRRRHERLAWPHALKITPVGADGKHAEPLDGCGKDISPRGIGFYLPQELKASEVLLELPNRFHPPSIAIAARVVRVKRCADGWYEAGALFANLQSVHDHSLSSRAQIIGRPVERMTGTI
jgi:hypothetical protein